MSRPSRSVYPDPVLVTENNVLAAAIERMRGESFITIDTEFVRERTYWPELCVVQLGGANEVIVLDAQAAGLDLDLLGNLLHDPAVTKVFHAARQDLEIFLHQFGRLPEALFDTQVAAMVAGFGDQVGYDSLVASLVGGDIDKAHRFSDWSARPLSPAQIAYAAADVTYLRDVYIKLRARLEREGRLGWVAQEMAYLSDPATFRPDPETLWERLRPRTGNRRMLGVLRACAAWREREAQRVDVPRQRLLKDESLLEIAATAPRDIEALARVRGVSRGFAEGRGGAGLIAAIEIARNEPEANLPLAARKDGPRPSPALVSLLKVLLAAKAEQHDVAPKLLASSEEIDRLAVEPEPEIPALQGWRREVFGSDALALKEGRVLLGVDGRRIKLINTGS
jgi:ribonuclease D